MLLTRSCKIILIGLMMIYSATLAMAADVYNVDPSHTNVGFTVRHLVINKVRGKFNEFTGTIKYDEKDVTTLSLQGTIKVASIDTDHVKRDKHLRSPDFFDAEGYPEIIFKSIKVEKVGDGLVLVGNLTMRGTTKEVRVPFVITGKILDPLKMVRIGFEASLRINRQDFSVSYSKTMDNGGLVVGNMVNIELVGEAVQQAG